MDILGIEKRIDELEQKLQELGSKLIQQEQTVLNQLLDRVNGTKLTVTVEVPSQKVTWNWKSLDIPSTYVNTREDIDMAKLSYQERKKMPKKEFAVPSTREGGKGGYPIPDKSHARNALARVSQFGSSSQKALVRAKVHSKYPGIGMKKGK
jgi:hypothetical protein